MQALLCLGQHTGYTTRLFLPHAVTGRGANWSSHAVLGKPWWTWSWNQVPGLGSAKRTSVRTPCSFRISGTSSPASLMVRLCSVLILR
jgi:hypothetical protein